MDDQHIICPFCGLPEGTAKDKAVWTGRLWRSDEETQKDVERFCWAELDKNYCVGKNARPTYRKTYAALRLSLLKITELQAELAQLTAEPTDHAPA